MTKIKFLKLSDHITQFAFYMLAAAVTFSIALTEIAVAVIVFLWIIKRVLAHDASLPVKELSLILLLFVLWNLLSFINTTYIYESARGLLKVLKYFLLFLATVDYFREKNNKKHFLLFFIAVGFLISLNGIFQHFTGTDLIRHRTIDPLDSLHRIQSSFVHSNDFGAYLVVIISILMSLFFSTLRRFKQRLLLLLVSLPMIWCLAATGSRGAWIGFTIASLCLFALKSKKMLAIVIVLLCLSPFIAPNSMKARFADMATIGSSGTAWERTKLWKGTIDMIKVHPVIGFGVNTYTKNFPKYKPKEYPDVRYTHNSYLHMAAEIGVVGFGIFIAFLFSFIIAAYKSILVLQKGIDRDLLLGITAGMIGFLAHCFVDTHLYSVTLSVFLYLCLGVAVSLRKGDNA